MRYKFFGFAVYLFLLTNCGFSVVNNNINYNIAEINTIGDKKINFILKNKLFLNSNKEKEKIINLNLNTSKTKTIKEKNISNQITKYQISINTDIEFLVLNSSNSNKFNVTKNGSYEVATRHSETLNNEKKLIKLLINDLSEEILEKLSAKIDEL